VSLIIPPGFAQVLLRYRLANDPEEMLASYAVSVDGDPIDIAGAISTAHITAFPAASMSDQWTYVGVTLRVGQDGGPPVVVELLEGLQGTATDPPLPNNCAYLIRKQTARGGRQGRGRMYLPPFILSEGSIDANGMLQETDRSNLQGLISEVCETAPPFLLHDESSPGSSTPDAIVGFVAQIQLATQRRRMRR